MASVISLRGLRKTFVSGELRFEAVCGVTFEVMQGEFVALVGPSGSGKSTLMNLIGCLDRPTEGTYLLGGYDVSRFGLDELAAVRSELLGFVFQGFNLLERYSALENVEMPLGYLGLPAAPRRKAAAHALELVGLGAQLHSTPAELSGGQQQRVAIARALATSPAILLADEPTGNLDSGTTEEILALLQALHRDHGLTIIIVTHDPHVAACASRVVTMRDGVIESDRCIDMPRRAQPASSDVPAMDGLFPAVAPDRDRRAAGFISLLISASMALHSATRSLARAKLRAALTVLGILVGIAAVVTTGALGAGVTERIQHSMGALGANMLIVVPASANPSGVRGALGSTATLTDEDAEAIASEVPTVSAVAPVMTASVQVVGGARNASTRMTGTTPGYFGLRDWRVAEGDLWGEPEQRAGTAVCAIGATVRRELFGRAMAIGRFLRAGGMGCTIVAVLMPKGQSSFGQDQDDTVILPLKAFRAGVYSLGGSQVNVIMLGALSPNVVHRTEDSVTALLHQRHRIGTGAENDFQVNNLSDILDVMTSQTRIVSLLLLVVASISLLVGGIGVMNIMLVSVIERTREIGIRMSVGARSSDILAQFLVEAVVLATIGGVSGLLMGVAASAVLGHATQFSVAFQPGSAVEALAVSTGVGVVFGFLPARRAAKLDPIAALRHA